MPRNTQNFKNWYFEIAPAVDQSPVFRTQYLKYLKWQWELKETGIDVPLGKIIKGVCIYVFGVRASQLKRDMPEGNGIFSRLETANEAREYDFGPDAPIEGPFEEEFSNLGSNSGAELPTFKTEQEALIEFEKFIKIYGWSYSKLYIHWPALVKQHSEYVKELVREFTAHQNSRIMPFSVLLSIPEEMDYKDAVLGFAKFNKSSVCFCSSYDDLIETYRGESIVVFENLTGMHNDFEKVLELLTNLELLQSSNDFSISLGVKIFIFVDNSNPDVTIQAETLHNKLTSLIPSDIIAEVVNGVSRVTISNYYMDIQNTKRALVYQNQDGSIDGLSKLFKKVMKTLRFFEAYAKYRRLSFFYNSKLPGDAHSNFDLEFAE